MSDQSQPTSTTDALADTETDTATDSTAQASGEQGVAGKSTNLPVSVTPSIKPVVMWMVVTVLGTGAVIGLIVGTPLLSDNPNTAQILMQAVGLVGILILIRLGIKLLILSRTTYRIDAAQIQRRYTLLLRTWDRQVPIEKVRSSELRQGRVQKLLGFGTLEINDGLGDITLENVENPTSVRSALMAAIEQN